MIYRRKVCAGKFFLATTTLVVFLWMSIDLNPSIKRKSLVQDGFYTRKHDGVVDAESRVKVTQNTQVTPKAIIPKLKCSSMFDKIKITANYSTNQFLDSMRLSFQNDGLHAESDIVRQEPIAKDVPGLEESPLQVIVIPHSHNDPGWKKTYMQYYHDQTVHILDNIVEKLIQYKDLTFVWVESCFLNTWWTNQTITTREKFRQLVHSGRLELVSGMWVAPDEASTHYFALIDQLIEGHHWVKENIGVVPQTSLNFDQFGYSSSIPYLMQASGLKNVLIKRIHRGLKEILGKNKWLSFNWRQFWDPHGKHDIFGQVDTYEWMSISDSCGPDRSICRGLDFSVMPDLPSPDSPEAQYPFVYDKAIGARADSLHDYIQKVVRQFKLKSSNYPHKVMMLPHGGDFHYVEPKVWDSQYRNLKMIMQYVNERKDEFNVHMRFGTFKDYFLELEKQTEQFGISYPTFSGDFFTYTESSEYWTGYFTTRQFDKKLSREVLENLRAAELISAFLFLDKNTNSSSVDKVKRSILANLVNARRDLGIFQHHDAITGTSQAHVMVDYEKRLTSAFTSTHDALSSSLELLLNSDGKEQFKDRLNSVLVRPLHNKLPEKIPIKITQEGTSLVLLNTFTQAREESVIVTLKSSNILLLDEENNEIEFDVISHSENQATVVFPVSFQALNVKVYTIKPKPIDSHKDNTVDNKPLNSNLKLGKYFCQNDYLNITFSASTGTPERICYKDMDFCTRFELDWRYFKGHGGAYTMISNGIEEAADANSPKVKTIEGDRICGVVSVFEYFSIFLSLPNIKGTLGKALKVNIYSDLSKKRGFNGDLAMRVRTDIGNSRVFYTDSNGVQLLGRKFRDTLPFDANVYPMSSTAMMEGDIGRVIVHSAQPHGVTSRTSGVLDFMIDRVGPRPEMDMPEPAIDNKPTETVFLIEFQTPKEYQTLQTQETALLSMKSVLLNDLLQHPIFQFYATDSFFKSAKNVALLQQPISCDIIFANVKNLINKNGNFDGVSLTLFKRAISCSKEKEQICPLLENTSFSLSTLFKKEVYVHEVSLSHLNIKKTLDYGSVIDLEPMDIKTFHLR